MFLFWPGGRTSSSFGRRLGKLMINNLAPAKAGVFALAVTAILCPVHGAQAQTVVAFDGTIASTCILAISTPGGLGMSTTGTEIGSDQAAGVAAVLSVTATAGAPTLSFTAPSMSLKPSGYGGTPAVSLAYTSPGGANQAYTNSSSNYTSSNPLGDTVTINAKAVDSNGFIAGVYRVQTTVTCSQ